MNLIDAKTRTFTEAYNDYYPLLYNVIYSKIGDDDTTQDICQDVFTRFLVKFDTVQNHRTWLYGTMKNVLLELYKKKKATAVETESLFEDITMSFVNGFRDSRIMIEEALENIENFGDEKGKTIFDMVALYNYTYKEVGKELGITERMVRYKYTVIVDKLMAYFRSKGIHGLEELL